VIAAVVLAAGAATRFGAPKQRLLLPLVLERLARCELDPVVVVEGAHPLADVVPAGFDLVRCADWGRGRGASLRCGLASLADAVEGAIVVLADGPGLDPGAVDRVLARRADGDVVAASYHGARGHPLYLARAAWRDVPDEGMGRLPAVLVPCDDLGRPGDVDTPDAWPGV
jgi:nicotine blue oxidoreductase